MTAVSALIAVTAAARVLIAGTTGLCFGESYYFSCALHPSLSYFDPTYECVDMTGLERAFRERALLDGSDVFVISDRWFRAGKVDYGLKGRLPVLALYRGERLKTPYPQPYG